MRAAVSLKFFIKGSCLGLSSLMRLLEHLLDTLRRFLLRQLNHGTLGSAVVRDGVVSRQRAHGHIPVLLRSVDFIFNERIAGVKFVIVLRL